MTKPCDTRYVKTLRTRDREIGCNRSSTVSKQYASKANPISLRKFHPFLRNLGRGKQKVIQNVSAGLIYPGMSQGC
jgi:hypothetical protein